MKVICLIIVTFLTGCGYRFVSDVDEKKSISLRNINNDKNFFLTSALVQELQNSYLLYLDSRTSIYDLELKIIDLENRHVDFQYQTEDTTNEIINRLSPVGAAYDLKVEMVVYDKKAKSKILGPVLFTQNFSYDFFDFRSYNDIAFTDEYGNSLTSLSYSLGQLAAEDDAKNSSKAYLFNKITKKIIAYLELNLP